MQIDNQSPVHDRAFLCLRAALQTYVDCSLVAGAIGWCGQWRRPIHSVFDRLMYRNLITAVLNDDIQNFAAKILRDYDGAVQ